MAEAPLNLLQNRLSRAIEAITADLAADSAFTKILPADAHPSLAKSIAVWRKVFQFPDRNWVVDVGLPLDFPDEVPRAYVADWESLVLRNPHVDRRGFICTIPDSAAIDSNDPVKLIRYVFEDAEKILKGTSTDDFREEFGSYWKHAATDPTQSIFLVDPVELLNNPFSAIFQKGHVYVGVASDSINRWIANQTALPSALKGDGLGIAINLNAPLLPTAYPNTLADLISLAEANDAVACRLIKRHIVHSSIPAVVLLIQKEGDGVALGGIVFQGLNLSQSSSKHLIQGFRPGKVPDTLLCNRSAKWIALNNIARVLANRVDHHWIHSRGGDGRDFSKKSALLIGCGSLGGYVAHLLSRAGIGRLTMTDNDSLDWDNLGRHVLGAAYVGRSKAEALSEELSRELPHLAIRPIAKDWRSALVADPGLFAQHDIIISTTADWRSERPLNYLARKTEMPPLLLGWVEPFAVAGHCLTIARDGGCFECAADTFGRFRHAVAGFSKTPLSKEPGGCTHYQHYGPIALMPVASMIAAIAVESLLNPPAESFLNTWVSSEEHFKSVQANVTESWIPELALTGYSKMSRIRWSQSPSCNVCANIKF